MSITVAFYKAEGRLFDKVIRWWTHSPYSHCELVIDGLGYSSSGRDHGVRAKPIEWKSGHWDYVEVSEAQAGVTEAQAKAWFEAHLGRGYDWFGLLWFVFPLPWQARKRWFCSEACAEALGFSKPWKYSPHDLYVILRGLSPDAAAAAPV